MPMWSKIWTKHGKVEQAAGPSVIYEPDTGNAMGTVHQEPDTGNAMGTVHEDVILDRFQSFEDVQAELRANGLESSNLILGVDFTKSNEWNGKHSFDGKSLHHLGDSPNPYEAAIEAVTKTLSGFDDDGEVPCFGFGDAKTKDRGVFPLKADGTPCEIESGCLAAYRSAVGRVRMAGPTSFAPIIHRAIKIVEETRQYHILVIIADGQVTRSVDLLANELSEQEEETIEALVAASQHPLSVVMIGVGDGPWDQMEAFDDRLPARQFDNFQFVDFHQVMAARAKLSPRSEQKAKEAAFALTALMEIPDQFRSIQRLGLLRKSKSKSNHAKHSAAHKPRRGHEQTDGAEQIVSYLPPTESQRVVESGVHHFWAADATGGASPARDRTHSHRHGHKRGSSHRDAAHHRSSPRTHIETGTSPSAARTKTKRSASHSSSSTNQSAGDHAAVPLEPLAVPLEPLPEFLDPITHELMQDPVMTLLGNTYSRRSITEWLEQHNTDPLTNQALPSKRLIPNHAMRMAIDQHSERSEV